MWKMVSHAYYSESTNRETPLQYVHFKSKKNWQHRTLYGLRVCTKCSRSSEDINTKDSASLRKFSQESVWGKWHTRSQTFSQSTIEVVFWWRIKIKWWKCFVKQEWNDNKWDWEIYGTELVQAKAVRQKTKYCMQWYFPSGKQCRCSLFST